MKALVGVVQGWGDRVPIRAAQLFEMARFLERVEYHWTANDYRAARAGDIAWLREYWALTSPGTTETSDKYGV